jgi:hypothetical protein
LTVFCRDLGLAAGVDARLLGHRTVAVRVYKDFDRILGSGSGGKISQSDINMAVRSLQPVPIIER